MNIHKVIIEDTPDSMKNFLDVVARIEKKIDNGQDYSIEKTKLNYEYAKFRGGISDRENSR